MIKDLIYSFLATGCATLVSVLFVLLVNGSETGKQIVVGILLFAVFCLVWTTIYLLFSSLRGR
jgi:hypothetical protein